jgi:endogenous inhibitor of DNA gyrase (YacG/DUF329 family)
MVVASIVSSVVAVVLVLLLATARVSRACPSCQSALPRFRAPKSWQEALWGGVTCPTCGVESDWVMD